MLSHIKGVNRDYTGYILHVYVYDYDIETEEVSNERTEKHVFDNADELELYCERHAIAVDTDGDPYDIMEWPDGTWLVIHAEPAHQIDPLNH